MLDGQAIDVEVGNEKRHFVNTKYKASSCKSHDAISQTQGAVYPIKVESHMMFATTYFSVSTLVVDWTLEVVELGPWTSGVPSATSARRISP